MQKNRRWKTETESQELTPEEQILLTQLLEGCNKEFGEYDSLFNYIPTWMSQMFFYLPHKIIALFCGNQALKTSLMNYQLVMRVYGLHPVPKKNVLYFECEKRTIDSVAPHGYYTIEDGCGGQYRGWEKGTWNKMRLPRRMKCPYCGGAIRIHKRNSNVFRLASEIIPTDKSSFGSGDNKTVTEVRSTMYPELKKWLPDYLITRDKYDKRMDISTRTPTIVLNNPNSGRSFNGLKYEGQNIVLEFVAYTQSTQSTAGKQRLSVICDEESPLDFWEEQYPGRLVAEDGDIILGVTPAIHISWTYDEIHEKGKMVLASDAYVKFAKKSIKKSAKNIEYNDTGTDIAVIKAATDDNPTLSKEIVEDMFKDVTDPETLATRRYGIHRQSSGAIFKDFSYDRHVIHPQEYFENVGWEPFFEKCTLARTYDYHTHKPHAVLWTALSLDNELFITNEFSPSPDKWVTRTICEEIARISKFRKYKVNVIDPYANQINSSTGKTTIKEMNDLFMELRRNDYCAGGYWEPFNTKGDVGRNGIKQRLAGSLRVGKPFNNIVIQNGIKIRVPTIWIFDNCHEAARSLKHWRLEETKNIRHGSKDEKTLKPAQKFSHYCTAIEGLLKDSRFAPKPKELPRENEYRFFNNKVK